MRLELGYPNEDNERELITGEDRRSMLGDVEAAASPDALLRLQKTVEEQEDAAERLENLHAQVDKFVTGVQ